MVYMRARVQCSAVQQQYARLLLHTTMLRVSMCARNVLGHPSGTAAAHVHVLRDVRLPRSMLAANSLE